MKYVMFDNCFPVIFQEGIAHKDITVFRMRPTSAGFIKIIPKIHFYGDLKTAYFDIKVFGESQSLGLKPSEKDLEIFEKYFGEY